MKVVKFCGYYCVRDQNDDLCSGWFKSKGEAIADLQRLEFERAQGDLF